MNDLTLEEALVEEYIAILTKQIEQETSFITDFVCENYPERVGYLRGLKNARDEFLRVRNNFFAV